MTRRNGIYSWENEPAEGRRSEFTSTVASDWRQSSNSTFAEPSRLERERQRRGPQRNLKAWLIGVGLGACLVLLALWATVGKLLQK